MKTNTKKNVVSLDTSGFTEEMLQLLASLVNKKEMSGYLSEEEGCVIIGNILKRLRKNLGLTQAEMAQRVGYDKAQFISNVERGAAKLPIDRAKAFVTAYEGDEKLHPAILKLIHHGEWRDVLVMVEMAGADSPSFDQKIETWIAANNGG